MLKRFLLSLPDVLLICIVLYIMYTNSFSFGQMLVISIAIGIIGVLLLEFVRMYSRI
ncbi:hypothetical protein IK9_03025 [Bacillus cereus VD166]|nr:hypothetical protein IK9_03025 [Bacillus cereus VD166]